MPTTYSRAKRALQVRGDSSICYSCRTFLDRPTHSKVDVTFYRWQNPNTLGSAACNFCHRMQEWLQHLQDHAKDEYVELTLRFEDDTYHSTYRPTPPTLHTMCRVDLKTYVGGQELFETASEAFVTPVCYKKSRRGLPLPTIVHPLVGANTRNDGTMNLARTWIMSRLENLKSYTAPMGKNDCHNDQVPAHLIYLDRKDRLRLIDSDQTKPVNEYRYATLTHRWAQGNSLQLKRANKNKLKKNINVLSLSLIFRDSVRFCQFLNISYLWIDRLCIVQDNDAERSREISNMGRIYENAFVNIGALAAARSSGNGSAETGLFIQRSQYARRHDPVTTRVRRSDYDELCYFFPAKYDGSELNYSALMARGSVLLECLLSTRSIYFDNELRWECSELFATEYYPHGFPLADRLRRMTGIRGQFLPFRIRNLLMDSRHVDDESKRFSLRERYTWPSKYQSWMEVVEAYTRCDLTHKSDRFLALSGLAKYFMQELNDEYVAGLWRRDLYHEILWHCNGPSDDKDDRCSIMEWLTAPTWSWASRTYTVLFLFNSRPERFYEYVWTARIHAAAVTLKGSDSTEGTSKAYIRMSGPIRETTPGISMWTGLFEWYDEGYVDGQKMAGYTYHFLMGYTRSETLHPPWKELKFGLILGKVEGEEEEHARVGMFAHPIPAFESNDPDLSPPPPGKCAEFACFDMDNYGRHTVTIV